MSEREALREALASALYETDPPESWMATGTDEYRTRALRMIEIFERDGRDFAPFDATGAALAEAAPPSVERFRTDRHPEDNGLSYNDGWNDALDSIAAGETPGSRALPDNRDSRIAAPTAEPAETT